MPTATPPAGRCLGDHGARADGGAVADGDPAQDHGALPDEYVAAEVDLAGAVSAVPVVPVVVRGGDEDAVGQHAAVADGDRVDGVQVDVVAQVDAIPEDQFARARLALQPGAGVDGALASDADPIDALELAGPDDDRSGAERGERPGVHEPADQAGPPPVERGTRLGDGLCPVHEMSFQTRRRRSLAVRTGVTGRPATRRTPSNAALARVAALSPARNRFLPPHLSK